MHLANGHLLRVPHQSRLSTNCKGNNEMIPGAEHRSSGSYLTAEKTPENTQLGDRHMTNHRFKWGTLNTSDVGKIKRHTREGERRKQRRKGRVGYKSEALWSMDSWAAAKKVSN